MPDRNQNRLPGINRMGHPLSHTAAVVGGVATIALAGCAALLLSDRDMLRSPTWWTTTVLAAAVLSTATLGYFRPNSPAIYIPVILSGLFTLSLCLWHLWWALQPHPPDRRSTGLYKSLIFFAAWLTWAARKISQLRADRKAA